MTEYQPPLTTPDLQHALEHFYYYEARLLDGRQYQSWLKLIHPDISYSMPGRSNPIVDSRERGEESMISVDRELEGIESEGLPFRDENYAMLWIRVERSYKANSWAENPPARTRRIIGNIEVTACSNDKLSVLSNFHLHYARPGMRDFFFAGQRRDCLLIDKPGYQILKREIIMDLSTVNVPTLGIFL